MSNQIAALHPEKHGHIKVVDGVDMSRVHDQQILPLVAHEFAAAACAMPVIFIKNSENGQFQAAGLLGFKPGENLYVQDGKWTGAYMPRILEQQPFGLVPSPHNPEQLMLAIDESNTRVQADGHALYEGGKETEYLAKRRQSIIDYFEQSRVTSAFAQLLSDLDVLSARTLSVDVGGDKVNLNGLYFIDEAKVNALPDDKYLDLRKRGFIGVIYAHLVSLNQVRHLVQLKADLARA
ncbi:MAG: multidrug transporter [Alphaproteobacteria bacterium]|nr:MAG: multidrug transporter [Alphaproteobacteria bacterium]